MSSDQRGTLLYLVRHGEAKPEQEDPARPLSDQGRQTVERMAAWAQSAGIKMDRIRHSGKLRAQQTAEIFAERLGVPAEAGSGLAPNDDVRPIAESINEEDGSVMLVGHLPFLGRLVSYLVVGDPERSIVQFEASAVVGLRQQDEGWTVACVMQPSFVP